jgi:hypothetical protein
MSEMSKTEQYEAGIADAPDVRPLDHLAAVGIGGMALFYVPAEQQPPSGHVEKRPSLLRRVAEFCLPAAGVATAE